MSGPLESIGDMDVALPRSNRKIPPSGIAGRCRKFGMHRKFPDSCIADYGPAPCPFYGNRHLSCRL